MTNKTQIGLVQHSTFLQRDLETLSLGQVGLSTDECRMFVGLPSSIVPASLVAGRTPSTVYRSGGENVELLTEFTPAHVLNRVLYKPTVVEIQPGTNTVSLPTCSRAFVDYMAYPNVDDLDSSSVISSFFECGTMNILSMGGASLVSQNASTNNANGELSLALDSAEYDTTTSMLNITLINSSTLVYTVEMLVRGWDGTIRAD